eukprot:166366_1
MSHPTHRDLTKRFKRIRNRYQTTPLDQFDNMISLPATSQIMTTPLYYKSPQNEYIITLTSQQYSSDLKCFDIHHNVWIPVSYLRPLETRSTDSKLIVDYGRTYKPDNRGIGIAIHKTNNTLYLICCQEARYCYCNLQPLDLQSPHELIFKAKWWLHSGLEAAKCITNPQCVYVDVLQELHVFGSDTIRSYHFILDEMEVFGDGFMETEGINGNRALRITKMIHIKYSNELMVFGANHPMQNGPFQQSTWSRSVPTNVVIWKYTLGTHSKWDRVETKVPFQLGNKPNSTFQVIVVFEYIVVVCMAKKVWFWNLVQNKWYHCCKTLPRCYDYLMITDDNMVHCFANGTNENRHIRFRLCDIMPSELCKELKNSYGDLVDKYTDYHFQYKMPHDIKRITLCYFVPF